MSAAPPTVVILFTDIEGSTRLWEQQPERMAGALAAHDALARGAVAAHGGRLVKGTGDGVHAVFDDAADALAATLALQRAVADPANTAGLPLALRCGLHAGADEARDNDFYGPEVNRAARIMGVAHGGQVLLSEVVAQALSPCLPDGVALRALGEVRLRDLQRTERVWQLVAPPLRVDFPPLRALADTPHNLVPPANRFIGRQHELAALRQQLAQHRLLTLLGPGGIGKTRLSLQLAHAVLDDAAHADGVWFVELSPLSDAAQVPQALAAVLGVKESAGQPLADALAACVRDRRLLIVLDNCEHLREAAAALAKRLLAAGPGVRLLASSREALHIAGEQVVPVAALSAPPRGAALTLPALLAHDAVRLFVDRAQAVAPGWQLADDDTAGAAALAEICQRLDGIPLAVELAAARARALPLPALAARLRDSFKLLTTTDKTVPPRQRTLALLIDWSHDLLSADEQCLLRRLSVFAGGFALEDAEAVCADARLPADDIVEHLAALVEKSLVQPVLDRIGDGHRHSGRYQLLDTIRHYAAQRLIDAADEDAGLAVQRRHVAHRLALAEAARQHIPGPEQAGWLKRLDVERDNLVAALGQAARDLGGAEPGLRLSIALWPYWLNRGLLTLGVQVANVALARPEAAVPPLTPLRAQGFFELGHLCNFLGQGAMARDALQACQHCLTQMGDASKMAMVLQPLGTAYATLGQTELALACFEQAVDASRALDRPDQLASSLVALAMGYHMSGRLNEALPLFEEALRLARSGSDDEALAAALLNLGALHISLGDTPCAVQLVSEARSLADRTGSQLSWLGVLDLAAVIAARLEDWPAAVAWHEAACHLMATTQLQRDPFDERFLAPWLATIRQHMGDGGAVARTDAQAAQAALTTWLTALAPALNP